MSDLTRLAGDMGTYVYLTVKIVCAVYILNRLWLLLFRRKAEGLWDRLYRWARIIRIIMWRWHKIRMVAKAERRKRRTIRNQKKKKEAAAVAPSTYCEVIGKTKSVYIPDPKKVKEPVRSEPLPESDFIGEDDDISADDVDDILEPMDEEDLQELMEPGLSEADPDFSQAMTYDDINNMVAVASGANKDETDTIRAVETLYSIRQSDIYEFILSESDNKDRIERLMNERFDEKAAPNKHSERLETQTSGFDWSQYV